MASEPEPERSNERASEAVDAEKQDSGDIEERTEEIEIKMISVNPEQRRRPPKVCEDEPYIVKLFKSLINPDDKSQKSSTEKKK